MTTPKSLRQPPQRRFEDYVLTRATSPTISLVEIHDNLFKPCSPALPLYGDPGQQGVDDGLSIPLPIGFDFQIDNITYKSFAVCTNGWMVLVDPTTNTFVPTEVLGLNTYDNTEILSTFSSNAILLAPWFDDLKNVVNNADQLLSAYGLTKVSRINQGFEPVPPPVNIIKNSVKYYNDNCSKFGRRLIIRWNSLSNYSSPSTILRFEVVIYENGKIEFRYASTSNINVNQSIVTSENAAIGIFMPNGVDRFRDFSYGLGYRDSERQQYTFGGVVANNSYTDTSGANTVKFTCNLRPMLHWPGLYSAGSMFVFSPPMARRKILPRLETSKIASQITLPSVIRTGDKRLGNDIVTFDDRRTLLYYASALNSETSSIATASIVVNMPTTLQRFYGDSEVSVTSRQNLFAGGIEFTSSIAKSSAEQFIFYDDDTTTLAPFSEHNLFENDKLTEQFYATGSSLLSVGEGLSQPLRSKTQLKFSLPIEQNCFLIGNSSRIYYYNKRRRGWNVPQNSTFVLPNGAAVNTSGIPKGDFVESLNNDSINKRLLIDDQRGFGAIGNLLSSGTRTPTNVGENSDAMIGSTYNVENLTKALNRSYDKSINTNEDYAANDDETFSIPITQPFLLEKAIIELPFTAGDGWFSDKTQCFLPIENDVGSFDFAGPAITVGLFNQVKLGNKTRRDLILSGTITHLSDSQSEIVFSTFSPHTSTYQIRQVGYNAFGGMPSSIITPKIVGGKQVFTGSAIIECEAQTTNGALVRLELSMTGGTANINRQGVIDIFNTSEITLRNNISTNFEQSVSLVSINGFGRGGTGFEPSGRSIFGNEFVTSTNITSQGKIKNPFYVSSSKGGLNTTNIATQLPSQISGAIANGSNFRLNTIIPVQASKQSPYLVRPGDSLVLSLSKTRPFFFGSQTPSPHTSGSIIHDISLITGAINITLYGSLLREGKEYHDTLNQTLSSDAIHEIVIGNDPVLDQFDGVYKDSYSSGSYDDYIAGTMLTKVTHPDGHVVFVTGSIIGSSNKANILSYGSRGRVFGKNQSTYAPTQGKSLYDYSNSAAIRAQHYKEKCGFVNINQAIDDSERYWDSLMPAINQCFLADGAGIFVLTRDSDPLNTNHIGDKRRVNQNLGFIWFDYQAPLFYTQNYGKILDGIWTWSFPFEPRYSRISRQRNIEKSFLANYSVDFTAGYLSAPITEIEPVQLSGFFFGPVGSEKPSVPAIQSTNVAGPGGGGVAHDYNWICDANLDVKTSYGYISTSSANISDTIKALFGFGDLNNRIFSSVGQTYFGTTHFADCRRREPDSTYNWGSKWSISPIIRGWKYGVYNGLPTFSKAYFRTNKYGQPRDMLEQRQYSKFYMSSEKGSKISQQGVLSAIVTVKFVDAKGKLTKPENTSSQNLSLEATSSCPYYDGETRNRSAINQNTLNTNILSLNSDQFGNSTL